MNATPLCPLPAAAPVKCAQIKKPTPRNENMIKSVWRIPIANKVAIEIWSRAAPLPENKNTRTVTRSSQNAAASVWSYLRAVHIFWRLISAPRSR